MAADYGMKGDLLDPDVNVEVGSRYVSGLIKDYKGDLERALAAYNAGPGVVDRYKGVPPYAETRGFVREVLAQYAEYNRRAGDRRRPGRPPGRDAAAKADRGSVPEASVRSEAKSRLKPAQVWRIKSGQVTQKAGFRRLFVFPGSARANRQVARRQAGTGRLNSSARRPTGCGRSSRGSGRLPRRRP